MAYDDLAVVAWKDWQNNNHAVKHDGDGEPLLPPPESARGVKVIMIDDEGNGHQFWIYTLTPFQDWSEWYVYIINIAADHNIELASTTGNGEE